MPCKQYKKVTPPPQFISDPLFIKVANFTIEGLLTSLVRAINFYREISNFCKKCIDYFFARPHHTAVARPRRSSRRILQAATGSRPRDPLKARPGLAEDPEDRQNSSFKIVPLGPGCELKEN